MSCVYCMCVRSGLQSDCINCGEVTQECWRVWECSSCSERGVRSAGRRAALHGDGCLACASIRLPHVLCLTHAPTPPSPCLLATRQITYTDQTGQGECKTCPAGTSTAYGLMWENVGSVEPSTGSEIYNWQLAAQLRPRPEGSGLGRVEFTAAELASYDAQPAVIVSSSFIKAGLTYFRPLGVGCQSCPAGKKSTAAGCVDCEMVSFIFCHPLPAACSLLLLVTSPTCKSCEWHAWAVMHTHTTVHSLSLATRLITGLIAPVRNQGKFAGSTGQLECTVCSAGKYSDRTASLACKNCTAGRWSVAVGSRSVPSLCHQARSTLVENLSILTRSVTMV